MTPLELLYETIDLPPLDLGGTLMALYGGNLGIARPSVYANFVASVDGVVALPVAVESGRVISGGEDADRFIMALLRALADAVVVGAGTFRRAEGDLWYPETVFPPAAEQLFDLRRRLGLPVHPIFVVVTSSGVIDPTQAALESSVVITTKQGAARLAGLLPRGSTVVVIDETPIPAAVLLEALRSMGAERILVEGGPTLLGHLIKAGRLDELFLTTSPGLMGRFDGDRRKSLIAGADVMGCALDLTSLRRHGSFLFARYRVRRA